MERTLAIDIGGSGIKVLILDEAGTPISDRARVETPQPAKPSPVIEAIVQLVSQQADFDRVSVGFPGVVRLGITETAVNLDPDWVGFNMQTVLNERLGRPVRVANDADIQGMGAIAGKGVELVITLGTGFGSALFVDGQLVPNLEMGHHTFRNGNTYEQQLGRAALDGVGQKKWNRRLERAIDSLGKLFNYDILYLGGGNTDKVTTVLPTNVKVVPNISGLLGGIALWRNLV